ncbi:hypothetical protein ACHAWF_012113 [Thalassiosira exigua]
MSLGTYLHPKTFGEENRFKEKASHAVTNVTRGKIAAQTTSFFCCRQKWFNNSSHVLYSVFSNHVDMYGINPRYANGSGGSECVVVLYTLGSIAIGEAGRP